MAYGDLVYDPTRNNALVFDPLNNDSLVYWVPPDDDDVYPEDPDNPWDDDNQPPKIPPTPEEPEEERPATGWMSAAGDTWYKRGEGYGWRIGDWPRRDAAHADTIAAMKSATPFKETAQEGTLVRASRNVATRDIWREADPDDPEDEDVYLYTYGDRYECGLSFFKMTFPYTHGTVNRIRVFSTWSTATGWYPSIMILTLIGQRSSRPTSFGEWTSGRTINLSRANPANPYRHYNIGSYTFSEGGGHFYYSLRFSDYRPRGVSGYSTGQVSGRPRIAAIHGTFYK